MAFTKGRQRLTDFLREASTEDSRSDFIIPPLTNGDYFIVLKKIKPQCEGTKQQWKQALGREIASNIAEGLLVISVPSEGTVTGLETLVLHNNGLQCYAND